MINWTLVQILSAIAIFLIAIKWVDKMLFAYYGTPLPFWHIRISFKKKILTEQEIFMKKYRGAKNGI